ncbi:MAG: RHS repeat-associated core domain-containing protein [Thermomicrobiales bacterium]
MAGLTASPRTRENHFSVGVYIRYTGAYLDSTGLYKMGARYYDPARGRFTQLDPLGNGYVYASDNPVNFIDPSGLDECSSTTGNCAGGMTGNGGCGGCEGGEPGGEPTYTRPGSYFTGAFTFDDGPNYEFPRGGPIQGYGSEPYGNGSKGYAGSFEARGVTPGAVADAARTIPVGPGSNPNYDLRIGPDGLNLLIDPRDGTVVTGLYPSQR